MYREDLKFKSIILKVLFIYLLVYFVALLFRFNYNFESLLNNIQYKYLILMNITSISLGLPLSIIFDFILIKSFGLRYVLFFSPVLTFLGLIQIMILRKINLNYSKNLIFFKRSNKDNLFNFFEKVTFKSFHILIIRTFPILPFSLGSYLIASSQSKKTTILINSFLGSYLYYLFLFLIIGNT